MREERERFVLDLYNQGKSTREIAEEARMSFRDIGAILNKAIEEKEASKEQAQKDKTSHRLVFRGIFSILSLKSR